MEVYDIYIIIVMLIDLYKELMIEVDKVIDNSQVRKMEM